MIIWKDVVGYEDLFKVSNTGLVFSKRSGKELKLHLNKKGYLTYATRIGGRDGESLCFKVHRLVAEAFLPPPNDLLMNITNDTFYKKVLVNHIDCNKANNNVENLEWCSYVENTKHAYENGLMSSSSKSNNPMSKFKNEEDRKEMYKSFVESGKSMRAFAKENNITHTVISRLKRDFGIKE